MTTLYRARVVRSDDEGVFVEVPDLGEGNEFGPLELPDRMPLALGDSVLVGSINDIQDDLAAVAKLVTTAYVEPTPDPPYSPPANASFVLYYENAAARNAAITSPTSGVTTWLDDEQRLETYTDESPAGWTQMYAWKSGVLLAPTGGKIGVGVSVPTATLESAVATVTDPFLEASQTGDTQPRLRIGHGGLFEWGPGGVTAPDVTAQRNATVAGLQFSPRISVGANPSTNAAAKFSSASTNIAGLILENTASGTHAWPHIFVSEAGSAANNILWADMPGDANPRVTMRVNGRIDWGNGTAAQDVNLYRQTVDELKTDDTFNAVQDVQVNGDSLPRGLLVIGERTSTQSGITTTQTATITLASATYKANRAYRLCMNVGVQGSTTNMHADFRVFKTTTGTTFTELYREPIITASFFYAANGSKVFKVGGSDVTAVLGLMVASSTGTVNIFGSASAPGQFWVEDIGPASKAAGTGLTLT